MTKARFKIEGLFSHLDLHPPMICAALLLGAISLLYSVLCFVLTVHTVSTKTPSKYGPRQLIIKGLVMVLQD